MPNPRQMIVEGYDDLNAIVFLMQHYVHWPDNKDGWPVFIQRGRSVTEILNRAFISTIVKQSGLQYLGLVLDADDDCVGRWGRIRALMSPHFEGLPDALPADGLIIGGGSSIRFGVWLMPNNCQQGMLESFLCSMVPNERRRLWAYVQRAVRTSRNHGATWRDAHFDKAAIHTFLSWHNPPGERFGVAIAQGTLDHQCQYTEPFVAWFRTLYDL